jgi:hypothetical protein
LDRRLLDLGFVGFQHGIVLTLDVSDRLKFLLVHDDPAVRAVTVQLGRIADDGLVGMCVAESSVIADFSETSMGDKFHHMIYLSYDHFVFQVPFQ